MNDLFSNCLTKTWKQYWSVHSFCRLRSTVNATTTLPFFIIAPPSPPQYFIVLISAPPPHLFCFTKTTATTTKFFISFPPPPSRKLFYHNHHHHHQSISINLPLLPFFYDFLSFYYDQPFYRFPSTAPPPITTYFPFTTTATTTYIRAICSSET